MDLQVNCSVFEGAANEIHSFNLRQSPKCHVFQIKNKATTNTTSRDLFPLALFHPDLKLR